MFCFLKSDLTQENESTCCFWNSKTKVTIVAIVIFRILTCWNCLNFSSRCAKAHKFELFLKIFLQLKNSKYHNRSNHDFSKSNK